MRFLVVILVAVAACSSSSRPKLSEDVAARLETLASECEEKPGNPGPPHGFHTEMYCHLPEHSLDAMVTVFLTEPQVIGQIQIKLAEPVETAIPRLDHALTGLVSAKDFAAIASELRASDNAKNNEKTDARAVSTKDFWAHVGVRHSPPVTPVEVSVTLRWIGD